MFEKSDPDIKRKIKEHLKELETFPNVHADYLKISGEKNLFRFRIGKKYRALFKVYEQEKIIAVVR